jgi:hypothetical protein
MLSCSSFWRKVSCAILALAFLGVASLKSQTFYGSIVGTVTDASGATIRGAKVTVTNTGTGEQRTAETSEDGAFRFVNLIPGTYKVEAEQSGFKHYTRDGIAVAVESAVRVDVAMQVGEMTQQVEVTSAAPLLQTENASLSQVVGSRAVEELPLNGRNVLNLAIVAPGVVPQGSSEGNLTGKNVFSAGNYQIGGGTANQSAQFLDGVPLNITYGNIVALVPSVDTVSEFRVQTNNNTAEYGRYTGGVINITSKSGSNEFHGGAYEYFRNTVLNATNFFANRSGAGKAPFKQNQFGATFGGPIKKDKTFFFFGYEGFRARQGVLFSNTVPTAAQARGDFSGYLNASGQQIPIYDPLTQCGAYGNPACGSSVVQRAPFPGNIIPASRISPVAAKVLAFPYYAAPNTPGQRFTNNFNFARNASTGGDNDQFSIRGDHQFSDKQRILARYTRWNSSNLPVDVYGNGLLAGDPYSPEHFVTQQAMLADTYVLNPTMIFDIRAGFIRWDYDRIPGTLGLNPATLGFPSVYSQLPALNGVDPSTTIPRFSISSPTYNQVNTGLLYGRDDTYTLTPTFTWIKGQHTWKFGAEIHKNDLNYFQNNDPGGVYTFDNLITSQNALNSGSTGSGLASFLLGIPNNGSYVQASTFTYAKLYYQGYYVMDTWQATKKLTLTLGARWEIPGVYREMYNRQVTFNFTEPNPALSGVLVNGQPVRGAFDLVASPNHPEEGLNPEKYHWITPRVGIAYRVSDRTVVRTGGGMFLSPATISFPQGPTGNPVNQIQTPVVGSLDNFVTYSSTLSTALPNGIIPAPGRDPRYQQLFLGTNLGGRANPYHTNNSYTYQWNFTIQHQFPGDIALEVGYAGLRGMHLGLGRQYNQINPQYFALGNSLRDQVPNPFLGRVSYGPLSLPTVQRGQLLSPYPQYLSLSAPADFSGDSTYHSLQVKAEKRFKSGGTLLGSYTYSKILSNAETLTGWLDSPTGVAGVQNWYNLRAEKALSSFDTHQRLVISYVYDLPFGKGRTFLSGASGFRDKLVSGWGINGLTTFQLGLPLGFTATPNTTGFNTGLRPNVAANCDRTRSGSAQSRLNGWFNTSCFSLPAPFTFGNESRTDPVLRGPGIANYDFAIFKRTAITERFNLEFRAEAFNLFNRVQFGQPNVQYTTAANSTFGVISTQLNQPRLMQMALRLRF